MRVQSQYYDGTVTIGTMRVQSQYYGGIVAVLWVLSYSTMGAQSQHYDSNQFHLKPTLKYLFFIFFF